MDQQNGQKNGPKRPTRAIKRQKCTKRHKKVQKQDQFDKECARLINSKFKSAT